MKTVLVDAINLSQELLLLADGTVLPITNYFDEWGDEVDKDDPTAVSIVAGVGSIWVNERLDAFEYNQSKQ